MKHLIFILQLLLLTFGANIAVGQDASPAEALKKTLEKTQLPLILKGTVTATSENASYAVIENNKTRVQYLFKVGDQVEGATVKKIDHSQVILRVNGQDQILELDITQSRSSSIPSKMALPTPQNLVFQTGSQTETGLPVLMKQARIRPFFSDGKPDGLLLYGITNDSVFQQIGLKNGDIIKAVNGSQTLSAQDAVTVYQSLDASLEDIADIRFTVLRRGKIQEILYNAQYTE